MTMMRLIYLFIPIVFLIACSEEEEAPSGWEDKKNEKIGKVTEVTTTYEDGEFENSSYVGLLQELELCGPAIEDCPRCATCSPRFFRFFDINKNASIEDHFALQVKALTILNGYEFSIPTREVRIYIRENGTLVECNRLKGYITQRITSSSGVDNLVVRFLRKEEGEDIFFNCLFVWSEKDKKYKYVSVERIEGKNWGGPVKEKDKKATSQQVYDDLKADGFIEGILQ